MEQNDAEQISIRAAIESVFQAFIQDGPAYKKIFDSVVEGLDNESSLCLNATIEGKDVIAIPVRYLSRIIMVLVSTLSSAEEHIQDGDVENATVVKQLLSTAIFMCLLPHAQNPATLDVIREVFHPNITRYLQLVNGEDAEESVKSALAAVQKAVNTTKGEMNGT